MTALVNQLADRIQRSGGEWLLWAGATVGFTVGVWLYNVGIPPMGDLVGEFVAAARTGVAVAVGLTFGRMLVDVFRGPGSRDE